MPVDESLLNLSFLPRAVLLPWLEEHGLPLWSVLLPLLGAELVLLFGAYWRVRALLGVRLLALLCVPLTALASYETWAELVKYENLYAHMSGGEFINGLTLNVRRFRAQRNFYMSLLASALFVSIYMVRSLARRLDRSAARVAELERQLGEGKKDS